MTREQRLQIENELMREYRIWYNPAAITDEDLKKNIETQKDLIDMLQQAYKDKEDEESAVVLITELMKRVIWEDILENRDPYKIKLDI